MVKILWLNACLFTPFAEWFVPLSFYEDEHFVCHKAFIILWIFPVLPFIRRVFTLIEFTMRKDRLFRPQECETNIIASGLFYNPTENATK